MAKYNITVSGSKLRVDQVVNLGDFAPRVETYLQPTFHLINDKIKLFESGIYKRAFSFNDFNEIGGVAPTDLEDAMNTLDSLTENFNGGGAAPVAREPETVVTEETSGTESSPDVQTDIFILHDAGATASLEIELPPNPKNKQKVHLHSVGGIVALTLSSVIGVISNPITAIPAFGNHCWMYHTVKNKWYKIL